MEVGASRGDEATVSLGKRALRLRAEEIRSHSFGQTHPEELAR